GGYASYEPPEERAPFEIPMETAAACRTIADVDALPWPDPDHIKVDRDATRAYCTKISNYAVMGGSWACFFHEMGWLMGQENYFVMMHTDPVVVEALTERIVDFHVAMNEKIFEAAADLMDFFFFGNDFGTQRGLFINPEQWRRFVLPSVRRLVDQAHSHGLKVWLHSCGSVRAIIPDLIDVGVDALHPLQVSAAGMSVEELGREYRGKLMFIGGIDVHDLLRSGTPEEVRAAVRHNWKHLGPSYAVSPSHETILPDVPTENVVAMVDEAKRL
ncbi:MAG: hypothetical protein HQ559_12465, partial [Lentisphaerae bacterium]|nr:hypothetical protein [Lentisphaerota bacterium]